MTHSIIHLRHNHHVDPIIHLRQHQVTPLLLTINTSMYILPHHVKPHSLILTYRLTLILVIPHHIYCLPFSIACNEPPGTS